MYVAGALHVHVTSVLHVHDAWIVRAHARACELAAAIAISMLENAGELHSKVASSSVAPLRNRSARL